MPGCSRSASSGTRDGGSGGSSAGGQSGSSAGSGGQVSSTGGAGAGGIAPGGAAGGGGAAAGRDGGSSVDGGPADGSSGAGGSTGGIQACPSLPGAPAGTPPLPSPAQLSYQRTEMTAFLHFSLATYDGSEQGSPSDSPSIFNPTNLNATTVGKWVTDLKEAGFRQATLVAKHSVGFALWPSKYTDYSVKSSPWMNGQGDVVKLFSDAMYGNDMRPAYYLAPWDQKYPSSKPDYETYLKNQAIELLAYGPAYEIWFDGANAPTSNVDWKAVFQALKQAQPNLLIWSGPEIANTGAIPDLQWIGNEGGLATRSTSSLETSAHCGGKNTWCSQECDTSSHGSWFWHSDGDVISIADMQNIYFRSVGMNCTLIFNVPPSKTGEFSPGDTSLLQQFAQWYGALYKTNIAKGQSVTADSTWAATGFEASKAIDDDICTYWAAASGKTSGRLQVTLPASTTANLISIREAIDLGERVKNYHVELQQNGTWNTATDKSGAPIQGTVIGNRQLWQLSGVKADAIALVIDSAKDVPAIAEFGVY